MLKLKKKATVSNILYTAAMAVLLILFVSPDAKSLMIQGMMKVGFFQPDVPAQTRTDSSSGPKAKIAPNAVFENGAGKKVSVEELKGKVVFINFWATWCPPCRAEMPTINKLYGQFRNNENIVFLIVDADDTYKKASLFLEKQGYDLPLYVPSGNIPYAYFSGALPTTVMINKEGEMVFRHAGAADYSDPKMVDFIKKLIDGSL